MPLPSFFVTHVNYFDIMLHYFFYSDFMLRQNNIRMWYKLITGREKFATLNFKVEKNPEVGGKKFLRNVLKFLPDYASSHGWSTFISNVK
jgi:hypothetical protein